MPRTPCFVGVSALAVVLLLGVGCVRVDGQSAPDPPADAPAPLDLPEATLTIGEIPVVCELAATPEARRRGLMWRSELPEDRGMLFIYRRPGLRSFWMRNTYIPLSVAFIGDDGMIRQIEPMEPLDDSVRYRSEDPVRFALEMNQGWFAAHDLGVGDRVEGLEEARAMAREAIEEDEDEGAPEGSEG